MDNVILCSKCINGKISYTRMIAGAIIPEWYCGLTNTDEFCDGEDFEEDI